MMAMLVAALTAFAREGIIYMSPGRISFSFPNSYFVAAPYESVLLYQDILRMNPLLFLFCAVGAAVILGIPPPGGRVPFLWYYHHEVADNRFDISASITCCSIAQNGRAADATCMDAHNCCVFRRSFLCDTGLKRL
ncbi:hypothetical protein TSMEX_010947 [Taenia solium]|eukprot:TsM_000331000 transcript=TsM_000331000 gene=TsM_000331000